MTPDLSLLLHDPERIRRQQVIEALPDPYRRELWQPDRNEQIAAVEVLMASTIPRELRDHLRDWHTDLTTRRAE